MSLEQKLIGFNSHARALFKRFTEKANYLLFSLHSNCVAPYLIILGFFAIAVASRLLFSGMVFRFDYGLYQPDGIHYSIRTLLLIGQSDLEAATKVSNWYLEHGTRVRVFNPIDFIPENNPTWSVIAPRVLYPILSAPFVYLMGVSGMLVIPSLSLLLTMFAIYYFSRKLNVPWVGFAIALSVSISPTVLRWAVSNCTDGLLMGIFSIVMLLLLSNKDSVSHLFWIGITVALSCLTRFCLPIWLILAILLLNTNKKRSAVISMTAIVFTAPTFLYKSESGRILAADNFSSTAEVMKFPMTFLRILFVEFAQLAALDRVLLIVVFIACIFSMINFRELPSILFFGVFLGVFTLGAINGVSGVNFRYQLPMIPFAASSIVAFAVSKRQKGEGSG